MGTDKPGPVGRPRGSAWPGPAWGDPTLTRAAGSTWRRRDSPLCAVGRAPWGRCGKVGWRKQQPQGLLKVSGKEEEEAEGRPVERILTNQHEEGEGSEGIFR